MSEPSRQELITNLYNDVFAEANPVNVAKYFAKNYIQQTNYDVLDFHDFIEHVKSLQDGPRVSFKLEFLVDTPEKVVVRTLVIEDKQIPGAPPFKAAACWPVSIPWPEASTPIIRTNSSSMKGWNRPIAFDPPPIHAITASGRRPSRSKICARASLPITL